MLNYLKRVLDYVFGRDIDTILGAFEKADRQLDRFLERQRRKRNGLIELIENLQDEIIHLADTSDELDAELDRGIRVQRRLREFRA